MADPLVQPDRSPSPPHSARRLCLLAILAAIPLAALLVIPMFGDMRFSYATCFQADHLGAFPQNVYRSAYVRSIGYKCLHYGLYRAAALVVDSRSPFAFELAARLMYYSGFALFGAWFFWLLRGRLAAMGIHWLEALPLFLVGLLATSHHIHQQPEELALLLTVGLTAFSLSDSKTLNGLSGLFLPLLLSCKIVTIWPAVFPFVMVLATRDRGRILRVGASWAGFTVATAIFYVVVIPQEIADARTAALCQSHFGFNPLEMRDCIRDGVWALAHLPFYLVAIACLGWFLWQAFERRQWRDWLLALGAIAIAVPPLFLQSLHLCYYYLQLFPAMFLIVLWTIGLIPDAARRGRFLVALAVATVAGWMFFSVTDVSESAYCWLWIKAARHQNATLQELDRKFHLSQEPEILFLSPGDVNYIIRAKSHLRQMAPVILQRAKEKDSPLRNTELFRRTLDDVLAYHGTYIYHSVWLPLEFYPELEAKLTTEYEPVTPKIEEFYPLRDVQLYRRKSAAPK
jgi:hypothetical protein